MSVPVRAYLCPALGVVKGEKCSGFAAVHKPLVERDAHRLEVLKEAADALRAFGHSFEPEEKFVNALADDIEAGRFPIPLS